MIRCIGAIFVHIMKLGLFAVITFTGKIATVYGLMSTSAYLVNGSTIKTVVVVSSV